MVRKMAVLILVGSLLSQMECAQMQRIEKESRALFPQIVPRPLRVEQRSGVFILDPSVVILAQQGVDGVADYLSEQLQKSTGREFSVIHDKRKQPSRMMVLKLQSDDKLKPEGYRLSVSPRRVELLAAKPVGLFYAVQTFLQLLPPAAYSSQQRLELPVSVPCVNIVDQPRFPWRGMMLDVSRHFMPKEFIFRFIDYLAMHKMNVFHWHLNDDQGWRLEIKRYPELTRISAWRVNREEFPWNAREPQKSGEKATYGGFYSQDDIREIVEYAQKRFVTIVPEIEMPGHCLAVLAAFPELSCTGGPFTVPPGGVWPIKDVYCAGNDSVFQFLENVLSEVMELFPGTYIHIGGDEVDKTEWKKCPKCQARMKALGLKTEEELQSYFIRRIESFLNQHGRRIIGWDEILQGGLAPNAAVMSWRGMEGGLEAASKGHDVVMTPTSHCYFDYYQGDPQQEPLAIGGYLPLSKVYKFEPIPDSLSSDKHKHILGVQGNLWTEYVPNPEHAQYMLFPRMAAMSEVAWSAAENRNWASFSRRLLIQLKRYEAAGINYARSAFAVTVNPTVNSEEGTLYLKLETELPVPLIRYTLDGSEPGAGSSLYNGSFTPAKSVTIKAAAFDEEKRIGPVSTIHFRLHKALGKPVVLQHQYQERYSAGGPYALTNGLLGTSSFRDGRWQGYEGDDLVATVDLGEVMPIQSITVGFLQNLRAWIFLPLSVEISTSVDGKTFQSLKTIDLSQEDQRGEDLLHYVWAQFDKTPARYVRVVAKNRGVCPDWHAGAGGKAWLFVDEIVVE